MYSFLSNFFPRDKAEPGPLMMMLFEAAISIISGTGVAICTAM
jgi:hypothetical protein